VQGAWKPLVAWTLVSIVIAGLLWAADQGASFSVFIWGMISFAFLPYVAVLYVTGIVPVARFLKGMREAGAHLEVVDDRVNWAGSRTVAARTAAGPWTVTSHAGLRSASLTVEAPGTRDAQTVHGSARRAGRWAVEGAPHEDQGTAPTSTRPRGPLAAAIVGSAAVSVVVGAWGIGRADGTWVHHFAWTLFWFGVGMVWFLVVVGVAIVTWMQAETHAVDMGRRAGGAALAAGAGAGVLALQGMWMASAGARGAPVVVDAWAAFAGGVALAFGVAVALRPGPWTRPVLVVAVAAAGVAAFLTPAAFFGLCTGALCLLALFQTLTRAPPTVDRP
jgi:hypothetical protein